MYVTTSKIYDLQDTVCGLNVTVVHMSKELWGDPEVFRPERFLDEHNNIINADKVLPFGGGKVKCRPICSHFQSSVMIHHQFCRQETLSRLYHGQSNLASIFQQFTPAIRFPGLSNSSRTFNCARRRCR
jgi:hypothetical protein